jgi:RNA polymerase sigma-70 factor (sigma-E family)
VTAISRSAHRSDPAGLPPAGQPEPAPIRAVVPFEQFYRRELKPVIGLAYALSGSRSAAEDLAQEAFLAAHNAWERVSQYDKPEAWVRRVVANKSVSLFRRKVREARALARMKPESSYLPRIPAEDDAFWKEVRGLPKRQSQAIALHYLEEMSVAEIAEILECAEGTVKVHLHKGRKRLADRLGLEASAQSAEEGEDA